MTNCSSSLDVPSDCARNSQDGNNKYKDIQHTAKNASAHNGKQQSRTRCKRPLDVPSDRTNDPYDNGNQGDTREQEQWATIKLVPVLKQGAAFRTLCPKRNDHCVLYRARCVEHARRDARKCPMQCRGCGYKFEAPDISQHPEWEAWRHEHRTAKGPASHTELEAEASQDSTSDSDVQGYSKPSGHGAVINATCIIMKAPLGAKPLPPMACESSAQVAKRLWMSHRIARTIPTVSTN